jgi:uncharacterized glyoxalase superfamily protein PhnB
MTLTAMAAVFAVASVGRSAEFCVERLGCAEQFRMGEDYAILGREALYLHLMPASRAPASLGQSSVYVFANGLDALHEELVGRGCPIEVAPKDYDYGMREFSVRDPDGNRITFGEEVALAL